MLQGRSMVDQRPVKALVVGSNPTPGAKKYEKGIN